MCDLVVLDESKLKLIFLEKILLMILPEEVSARSLLIWQNRLKKLSVFFRYCLSEFKRRNILMKYLSQSQKRDFQRTCMYILAQSIYKNVEIITLVRKHFWRLWNELLHHDGSILRLYKFGKMLWHFCSIVEVNWLILVHMMRVKRHKSTVLFKLVNEA